MLQSLETLLYELSVTGTSLEKVAVDADANAGGERESKKPRLEEEADTTTTATASTTLTVEEELTALRQRMEHRDSLREKLIKKCRDGQKMAKQAIYALHRNDYKKSESLIKECENWIINELLPIVEEEPPLRYGSFAGVIEEYAEAKLFYVWLLGKPTITDDKNTMDIESDSSAKTTPGGAKGILLLPHEFEPIQLQPEDYLGGVCDLTGEIGRYAVQCGTARDYDGVSLCLESNSIILKSIQLLERSPSSINKKMQQLSKSVEKIQRMTYEMSLSKAAGMNINTEVKTTTESDVADNAE
jgi:predicted translin family RNA/ssDNA-binding protein